MYIVDAASNRKRHASDCRKISKSAPALSTRHGHSATSDRLRETLFNVLTAGNPAALEGTVWLDLFAGTGAVGIEAISRGAKQVYFVESSAEASAVIRNNLESLGIEGGFKLFHEKLPHAFWRMERAHVAADVVFIDPPYRMQETYRETLRALAESPVLWAMSMVIAEHERKFDPGEEFGPLRRFRKLIQGSAALSFYRRATETDVRNRKPSPRDSAT
jgi:16S rRNA (guanine966-N2)-methyltransferase